MTRRRPDRRWTPAAVLIAGLALVVVTCPRGPARDAARHSRELYLELGRQRLLAGDAERALAYLGEAYQGAEDDAGLRFLVARAVEALRREAPGSGAPNGSRTVRLRRSWPESRAPISSADLNDDWTRAVAVGAGGEAAVFDAFDGRLLFRLTGAPAAVSVRFSPDGEQVAGLHAEGRFSLWASATGELLRTGDLPLGQALETTVLRAAGNPGGRDVAGLAMAFSAAGGRLATTAADGFARIWDTADGRSLESFETGVVTAAALHPGGHRLVTAGDRFAMIWNLETGRPIVSLDLPREAALESLVYSPDGRRILAAGRPPEVRLFDAASGELDALLAGATGTVRGAAFSPGGGLVVTAGDDGAARIWDAGRGRLLGVLPLAGSDVLHAEYGPRSAQVATIHADGTLDVQAVPLDEGGPAEADRLRRCLVPWRLATGRPLGGEPGPPGSARLVPATPDPASCGRLGQGIRRRVAAPREPEVEPRKVSPVPSKPVPSKLKTLPLRLETAVRGRVVDLAGKPIPGAEVRLWAEGTPLVTLRHGAALASAAFGADGRRVMAVADDGGARVWDLETGRPASELVAGEAPDTAAFSVSPDGKLVATISEGVVRVWEAGTGLLVGEPLRHEEAVRTVAFSPDGRLLLTASRDGAARLWQAPRLWPEPGPSDAESMLSLVRPAAVTDAAGEVRLSIDRAGSRQMLLVSRRGYKTPQISRLPSDRGDLTFVAELSDTAPASAIRIESKGSQTDLVHIVLRDADLVETIRSLAVIFGLDVVLGPEVRGTISAELPGGGLEETLGRILAAYGLTSEPSETLTLVFAEGRTLPPETEVVRGGRLPGDEPITMSLKNANLVETLHGLGSIAAAGLMIDPDVSGLVSAELRDVPWTRALAAILRVHDLEMEVSGTYWRIRRRPAKGEP